MPKIDHHHRTSPGYLELESLYQFDELIELHYGFMPSVVESFALGAGYPQLVHRYERAFPGPTRSQGRQLMNTDRLSAWLPERDCIWRTHGVWTWFDSKDDKDAIVGGKPIILKNNYFSVYPSGQSQGRTIDMWNDFYVPFATEVMSRIKTILPDTHVLVEPIPNEFAPPWGRPLPDNYVWSPHWYDLNALFSKSFGVITLDIQELSRVRSLLLLLFFILAHSL